MMNGWKMSLSGFRNTGFARFKSFGALVGHQACMQQLATALD